MQIEMLQAKLHRATVSDCCLEYPGSLTVDPELLAAAGIVVHQKVQIVNCNNGARFETYVIRGEAGDRRIVVNGAAARLAQPGDTVIIIAYCTVDAAEAASHATKVVVLGDNNAIEEIIAKEQAVLP